MSERLRGPMIRASHALNTLRNKPERSPELAGELIRRQAEKADTPWKRTQILLLADMMKKNDEWCWGEFSEQSREQYGRNPVLMEAWLDAIEGNKVLLRMTKKYKKPEEYPEIPLEKWGLKGDNPVSK